MSAPFARQPAPLHPGEFLVKAEQRKIGDPHRIHDAVEMIILVLDHGRVKPGDLPRLRHTVAIHGPITHPPVPRHRGPQPGNGQATLPPQPHILAHQLDQRIDQHSVFNGFVERIAERALPAHLEDEQPQRHVHLRRSQPGAGRILHRLDHVGDQTTDLRRAGIGDRPSLFEENRVAHAGRS